MRAALHYFHANYDRLAFPGGLARELERLRNGDIEAIELAVRYLEAQTFVVIPHPARHHKAEILKFLKRHPLTQEQCARLRRVILDRVRGRPVREMRAYGRLAPRALQTNSSRLNCWRSTRTQIVIPLEVQAGYLSI